MSAHGTITSVVIHHESVEYSHKIGHSGVVKIQAYDEGVVIRRDETYVMVPWHSVIRVLGRNPR